MAAWRDSWRSRPPCAFVTVENSLIIGLIAGVVVVLAVIGFDKITIDDPVGATSVHLVNGVFGTLCVGLFAKPSRVAAATVPRGEWATACSMAAAQAQLIRGQLVGMWTTAIYVLLIVDDRLARPQVHDGHPRLRGRRKSKVSDIGEHGIDAYHAFARDEGLAARPARDGHASGRRPAIAGKREHGHQARCGPAIPG